jgi:hypothetical protein
MRKLERQVINTYRVSKRRNFDGMSYLKRFFAVRLSCLVSWLVRCGQALISAMPVKTEVRVVHIAMEKTSQCLNVRGH